MKYLFAFVIGALISLSLPAMSHAAETCQTITLDAFIEVIKKDDKITGAAVVLPGPSREAFGKVLEPVMGPMPDFVQYLVVMSYAEKLEPKTMEKVPSFNADKCFVGNSQTYHMYVEQALLAAVAAAGDDGISTPSDEKVAPLDKGI